MTAREIMKSLGKKVYVNSEGKKAFADVDGAFYLVGFSIRMYDEHDKKVPHCGGYISRQYSQRNVRLVAGDYLELL